MTTEARRRKSYFRTIPKRSRLKTLSYRRLDENGEKKNYVFFKCFGSRDYTRQNMCFRFENI